MRVTDKLEIYEKLNQLIEDFEVTIININIEENKK